VVSSIISDGLLVLASFERYSSVALELAAANSKTLALYSWVFCVIFLIKSAVCVTFLIRSAVRLMSVMMHSLSVDTPFPLLNPSASTISGNVRAMEANVRAIEVPKPIIEQAMPIFD
jgi:hypothetical protein